MGCLKNSEIERLWKEAAIDTKVLLWHLLGVTEKQPRATSIRIAGLRADVWNPRNFWIRIRSVKHLTSLYIQKYLKVSHQVIRFSYRLIVSTKYFMRFNSCTVYRKKLAYSRKGSAVWNWSEGSAKSKDISLCYNWGKWFSDFIRI